MQEQVLSPSMQDADHADLGAQGFAIDGDLEQGLSTGGEQEAVKQRGALQRQRIELLKPSEPNMEEDWGQEFAVAGHQPARPPLSLARGAMPFSQLGGR